MVAPCIVQWFYCFECFNLYHRFEVEAGNLERSYRRGPRHAEPSKTAKVAPEPAGICHLCEAGLQDCDWEDAPIGSIY